LFGRFSRCDIVLDGATGRCCKLRRLWDRLRAVEVDGGGRGRGAEARRSMGTCPEGVFAVEGLGGLTNGGSWSRWDRSAGPCATWRAPWITLAGGGGIWWVGGSGNAMGVTVGATFGVLVGVRRLPFLPTLPGNVQSTLSVDRLGVFLYSCVNDDDDLAAEEAVRGKLPVD